jgi:hypothetical protein
MLHHESALFARGGVPNAAILRMATVEAAKSLGGDGERSPIAPGKVADLVLVDVTRSRGVGDIDRVISTLRAGVGSNPSLSAVRSRARTCRRRGAPRERDHWPGKEQPASRWGAAVRAPLRNASSRRYPRKSRLANDGEP